MIQDLIDFIHGLGDDDDVWMRCERVEYGDDVLRLSLTMRLGYREQDTQSWIIECSEVRTSQAPFEGDGVVLLDDHPLLWPHNKEVASLSFRGVPRDLDAVLGALWRAHVGLIGEWIPFTRFMNYSSLPELLAGGFGQLASGPRPLIEAYAGVLQAHGIQVHASNPRMPTYYKNDQIIVEVGNARLLMVGNGHVIAERFDAKHEV
ncbi:MAG: hypothetical protein WD716_08370 [Fimbriimonadaceae bacterium]